MGVAKSDYLITVNFFNTYADACPLHLIEARRRTILAAEGEIKAKVMASAVRAELESLLRAQKLDRTLANGWTHVARDVAATGLRALDEQLGGGVPRGHLSEIVGPRSSGRTTVLCRMFQAATDRGEAVALIDPCDRFDPASAAAAGVDLSKLLWVRERGDAPRALKALNLVLQAGGFGLVAFDVADVPASALRQFPYTTWMRIARVIESSQTAAMILAAERLARSPGGVTITFDDTSNTSRAQWSGAGDRARFLRGIELRTRVIGGRTERAQITERAQYGGSEARKNFSAKSLGCSISGSDDE
jgi:hypothetical protein